MSQLTMSRLQVICYGALGGCCPTIAKLASHYSVQWDASPPGIGAFLALLLFAILGSIVAIAAGPRNLKAAIIAGIAAPGIVTNIMSEQNIDFNGTSQQQETSEEGKDGSLFLFGIRTAIADSHLISSPATSDETAETAQQIRVESATGSHPGWRYDPHMEIPEIPIIVHVNEEGKSSAISIGKIPLWNAKEEFTVPSGSTKISVADQEFDLNNLESLTVNSTAKPRGGLIDEFLWAIGQKRKYNFETNVVPSYK